jgi:hypothetical protein
MTALDPSHRRRRFNLASQSRRQAGSAFKVFTLAAAVERGIPLSSVWRGPASLTIPSRRCLNANGRWVVHNFADVSTGTMTLRQAIAHSVNTIFAQIVMRVGPAHVGGASAGHPGGGDASPAALLLRGGRSAAGRLERAPLRLSPVQRRALRESVPPRPATKAGRWRR